MGTPESNFCVPAASYSLTERQSLVVLLQSSLCLPLGRHLFDSSVNPSPFSLSRVRRKAGPRLLRFLRVRGRLEGVRRIESDRAEEVGFAREGAR